MRKIKEAVSSKQNKSAATTAKEALKTTLGLTERALDGLPIPGVKGAVGGLLDLIRGLEKADQNSDALRDLDGSLNRLLEAVINPLRGAKEPDIPQDLLKRINSLIGEWNAISQDWKKLTTHNRLRRFIDREEHSLAITNINERLKDTLNRFALSGDIAKELLARKTLQTLQSVSEKVDLIASENQQEIIGEVKVLRMTIEESAARAQESHGRLITQVQLARLEKLPNAQATYRHNMLDATSTTCLKGTRVVLLKEIRDWIVDLKARQVYWLNGIAGVGKSTVARTIAGEADDMKILGASFFFSRALGRTESKVVFATIALQLAQQLHSFKVELIASLEKNPDAGDTMMHPQRQLRKLIIEPLKLIKNPPQTILIVFDAFDECEKEGSRQLLAQLLANIHEIPFLKLFITSRPEHHIRMEFDVRTNVTKSILHNIEDSIVQGDIRLFLCDRLESVAVNLPDCCSGWRWSGEELEILIIRAGKLFVFAATAIKFIMDEYTCDPRQQLDLLLGDTRKTMLESHPSHYEELDDLYYQILINILPPNKNATSLVLRYQMIVGTIVLLHSPLSLEDLEALVSAPKGHASAALLLLHSLIVVPSEPNEAPQVYHPSFPEFVTDFNRCKDMRFYINPTEHHCRITLRCFDAMKKLRKDICRIGGRLKMNNEVAELDSVVKQSLPGWVQYACCYWATHLESSTIGESSLVQALETYTSNNLLYWLEALSLLGRLELAIPLIQSAHKWAVTSKCSSKTISILADTLRMIPEYFDVISLSALHLYHSVLPFLPFDSALYEEYKRLAGNSVKVVRGREQNWNPCMTTLRGHSSWVTSVVFSPDGVKAASGSKDCTARIWDSATGRHLGTLEGHADAVWAVTFSPDGTRVATGSWDKTARIWDSATCSQLGSLEGHGGLLTTVTYSKQGDWIATGSGDNTARIWDALTYAHLATMEGHADSVRSVAFSPDDLWLVTGSYDATIRIWNSATGAALWEIQGHAFAVRSLDFSLDGSRIVSGSWDKTARIWDSSKRTHLGTLEGHTNSVNSVAFLPDSKRVVSCSDDKTVRIWDAIKYAPVAILEGHSDSVRSVACSPDGTKIISGSYDKTARIWDGATKTSADSQEGHTAAISSLAITNDGSKVVSGSWDRTACIWDAATGQALGRLRDHPDAVRSVVVSADAKKIVTGTWEDGVRVRRAAKDKDMRVPQASLDESNTNVWRSAAGVHYATPEGHSFGFTPDGGPITGAGSETARLWNGDNYTLTSELGGHTARITSAAFSPDSSFIFTASLDSSLRKWDATMGSLVGTWTGHTASIWTLGVSPNGNYVITASEDHTAHVWDSARGTQVSELTSLPSSVESVHFSIDGNHVLIGLDGGESVSWNFQASASFNKLEEGSAEQETTVGYVLDDHWVLGDGGVEGFNRTCRIPSAFSICEHVTRENMVAIGATDGKVVILDLS